MEVKLEFFINDRYKLLKLLSDNQIKVKDQFYISLSQQEIADMAHFSKVKTNKILNELKKLEFVISYKNMRSKYALTEKSHKVLHLIRKTII